MRRELRLQFSPLVSAWHKGQASVAGFDPVSMAWWLAGHQKPHYARTLVHRLMLLARCDLDSVSPAQTEDLMLNLHRQLSFQYEEELSCTLMMMPDFAGARRHLFFYDIQIRRADEEPAITAASPGVMLSILLRDNFSRHLPSMRGSTARVQRFQSGILPCFFGGFFSRFVANMSSAVFSLRRVSLGRMTASTYPRSAAI